MQRSAILFSAFLLAAGGSSLAGAEPMFFDDFEDRTAEQPTLGNNWTWYDQWFDGTSCEGQAAGGFGPFDDGDGSDYEQGNQNFANAGDDGGLYFRAGLEVPAWGGALSNMLRVYGNQYITYDGCHRVLIFQEMTVTEAGTMMLSFDIAQDQVAPPANGEITGAFVKVLRSSDSSYAEILFERVQTMLPDGSLTGKGYVEFTLTEEHVGELLQFGFYNDVVPSQGQSWSTSAILYDNVMLDMSGIGPAHSGSWYNEGQSGHGFSMEFGYALDGSPNAVVYWYTYDILGLPIFMLGTGTPVGDTVEIVFSSYAGMIYGEFAPSPPPEIFEAGTATFVFSDGDNGTFSYAPSDDSAATWGHTTPVENLPITKLFGVPASPVFETMQ
jgi:hypothetical protein